MKIAVTNKPMCFECECGERYLIGLWKVIEKDATMVVRFIVNKNEFAYCPFCGGGMKSKEMRVNL